MKNDLISWSERTDDKLFYRRITELRPLKRIKRIENLSLNLRKMIVISVIEISQVNTVRMINNLSEIILKPRDQIKVLKIVS